MPNTTVPVNATRLPAARPVLDRPALLRVLGAIQNSTGNFHRDIMTFAGMCSRDELADHVMSEWRRLN